MDDPVAAPADSRQERSSDVMQREGPPVSHSPRLRDDLPRLLAVPIALVAGGAFVSQSIVVVDRMLGRGLTVFDGFARSASYLTDLTVLMVAICFICLVMPPSWALARFFRKPAVVTAVAAYIAYVGIAYNLLLRYSGTPYGWREVLNEVQHSALPVLGVLYWLFCVRRFRWRMHHGVLALIYPIAYLIVTFWRGGLSHFYPYPFLNVDRLGGAVVARNVVFLIIGFFVLMGILLLINRFLKPARAHESGRRAQGKTT